MPGYEAADFRPPPKLVPLFNAIRLLAVPRVRTLVTWIVTTRVRALFAWLFAWLFVGLSIRLFTRLFVRLLTTRLETPLFAKRGGVHHRGQYARMRIFIAQNRHQK